MLGHKLLIAVWSQAAKLILRKMFLMVHYLCYNFANLYILSEFSENFCKKFSQIGGGDDCVFLSLWKEKILQKQSQESKMNSKIMKNLTYIIKNVPHIIVWITGTYRQHCSNRLETDTKFWWWWHNVCSWWWYECVITDINEKSSICEYSM